MQQLPEQRGCGKVRRCRPRPARTATFASTHHNPFSKQMNYVIFLFSSHSAVSATLYGYTPPAPRLKYALHAWLQHADHSRKASGAHLLKHLRTADQKNVVTPTGRAHLVTNSSISGFNSNPRGNVGDAGGVNKINTQT